MCRNILSCSNRYLTGADIKDWILWHTKQETEYTHIARPMLRYMNLKDEALYRIDLNPPGTGSGERKKHKPNVIRTKGEV